MPFESVINSFDAGELSPNIYGRTDLQQYRRGAAALTNIIVQPSGSAKKRPGTELIDEISSTARLIPFQVSATESHIVEITVDTLRVVDSDGTELYTSDTDDSAIADDFTADNIATLKYVQASFQMIIVDRSFAPKLLVFDDGGSPEWDLTNLPVGVPPKPPSFDPSTANERPAAVTFIDQRVVVAGTSNTPNAIIGSAVQALYSHLDAVDGADSFGVWIDADETVGGTDYKAGEYLPGGTDTTTVANKTTDVNFFANDKISDDADPYHFNVLDYGFIDIKWLANSNILQNGVMFAGTSAGLYAIIGASGGPISPAGGIISARRQSGAGCSSVQGIIVQNFLIFVDSSNRRIRVAQFNLQADQFQTPRINDLADHLFDVDIKEIHYQRSPNATLWAVLTDGSVRAFSYDATGALAAWTPMEFGGDSIVKSMTILPGEEEDTVVFCMYNAGQDAYTLEKMGSFIEDDQDEFWYVDSGVRQYNVTAFTTVTGLTHLEGEEVQIWADGGTHAPRTVNSGQITLDRSVNTAIVGRPYTTTITTLPIAESQDKIKRVERIFARFADTIGAKAGTDTFEEVVPFMAGNFEMGAKPAQFSGVKVIPYFGSHEFDGSITLLSDSPTPFHVLSVITRLEVYG